eukprot:8287828-Pyramimonas_sp.AAC.2
MAANSGAMIDGMLAILLDIGSNINISGIKTAQTSERAPRSYGHDITRLNLTKRLYVSGAEHGAAICDKSLHCKIACEEKGDLAGKPAIARLDTYSANAAEGYGDHLPATQGLRSMSNMGTILILKQGHEKMIIPGSEMYRLLLGKGARVLDLLKTPSGHLAIKVDEDRVATEVMVQWHSLQQPLLAEKIHPCSSWAQLMRSQHQGNLHRAARGHPLPAMPTRA